MATISKSGITDGGVIDSTHITRIIEALDGTGSADIYATGSFTGSFIGDGSQLTGIVGGGGTPGGSDTQIQYNNSNAFGGVPTLTYDGSILRATGSFSGSLRGQVTGSVSGSFCGQATGSFTGSFIGDGSGLTGIAGGGGALTWTTRASETNPIQAMVANNGYILRAIGGVTGAVMTLPSSGVSIGDIIKIHAYQITTRWRIDEGRAGDTIVYSFFDTDGAGTGTEYSGTKTSSTLVAFDSVTDAITGYTQTKTQSVTLTCVSSSTTDYHWDIELANGKLFG